MYLHDNQILVQYKGSTFNFLQPNFVLISWSS